MNVVITLPHDLIDMILSGRKRIEMRRSFPADLRIGVDGFFVIEKRTSLVRCYCEVAALTLANDPCFVIERFRNEIAVSADYIMKYLTDRPAFLWHIGEVYTLASGISVKNDLEVSHNPQSYVYTKAIIDDWV